MSDSIVTTTDQDTSTPRRSVARRACLSCREKKIKCDGEDISRMKNGNDSDKNMQHNPNVCTNCKFLGIECVFVRSMRGGRRKRKVDVERENAKNIKAESNNENTTADTMKSSYTGSTYSENDSPPLSDVRSKHGPPSPSSFYSMPFGEPDVRPDKPKREYIADGYGLQYAYDYRHYPPPPHHFYPPPPPPPHMMGYPPPPPLPPPPPGVPPFFHHLGPPPPPGPPPGLLHHPHYSKHHWNDHSTIPAPMMGHLHPHPHPHPHKHPHKHPHHKKHHNRHEYSIPPYMMGYLRPPCKKRHWSDYSTPPPMMGQHDPRSPSYNEDGGNKMKTEFSTRSGSPTTTASSGVSKSDLDPLSKSGSISNAPLYQYMSREESDSRHPPFIKPRLEGSVASGYSLSYNSNDTRKDTRLSDTIRNTYGTPENIYPPHQRGIHDDEEEDYEEPFSSYELMKYELPNWPSLNKLLDYYYKYNHSKHQLLSSKHELIKRISLNSDSSILHAIISTVSLFDDRLECETYWVERVFKYWDNLNDFGMLLSYSLISRNPVVQSDLSRLNDLNSKIWDLIRTNKFIDIVNEHKENLNSRQRYEKEILIRIIWNYWINHIVLVQFKQGFPRYQLSKEQDNVKLNDEVSKYMSNLELPLSDEENLGIQGKRHNCEELDTIDLSKEELADSHAVILATRRLETTIKKISSNELTEEAEFSNELNNYVNDKVLTINRDNTLLIINSSYLLASFITKTNDCLLSSFFISDIIFSGISNHQPEGNRFMPLADDFSVRNIFNFDGLSKLIEDLSTFQWNCLTNLIISISDIMKLIEIGSGILPNEDSKYLVIIGVTATSRIEGHPWWDNNDLVTDLNDSWYKYPDFALYSACSLVSMLVSLIILTKFIKFKKDDSMLKIELFSTRVERKLDLPTNHQFIDEFNDSVMLQKLSKLISFIKFKLQSTNYKPELINDTMEKFDQINLYIEETLGAISTK